ncbi:MAG: protein kinase domain-containing protein [Thermoanaerobaculia bacterium]
MTLTAGTRLGPYEIQTPLGAGGMGEVYRARDTRLGRSVAIKVLPAQLSQNAELRERFEREAKTISSLSHPHICALYDVGREDGTDFLVMELLEGETLAGRLAKGALPTEQVLRYGTEIADALDKAHRQGVVHRDLKPGNIMLTKSGVKLLDFGLAKWRGTAAPAVLSGLSAMPTHATPMTAEGSILGTFQYMAPEQLEGKETDGRSDIFAFGAVLYEMASGRKAFEGKSQAPLIAAILEHEPPPLAATQPATPAALDRLVKSCLAKDPDERIQTAHDVVLQLRWIGEGSLAGVAAQAVSRRKPRELIAWIGLAAVSAVAAWLALGTPRRTPAPESVFRSSVLLPEKVSFQAAAISPDGTRLAFTGEDETGKSLLWLRPLDSFKSQPLAGTENGGLPFWSPDGRYIAYFASGKLKRIEAAGGSPLALYDVDGVGGAWGPGGDILFAAPTGPIYRLPASGGKAVAVTKLDEARHETSHRYPFFLPDGRHFLYVALNLAGSPQDEANRLHVGSLDSSPGKPLMPLSSNPVYSQGYVLFIRGGTNSGSLLAQAFDPERLEIHGEPLTVAESISANLGYYNFASFTVSRNGVLVYDSALLSTRLEWLDRAGRPARRFGEAGQYGFPRMSPDGARIAFTMYDTGINKNQIWIGDVARGVQTKLTGGPGENTQPLWSPDGFRVAFTSDRKHQGDLFVRASSGASGEEALSDEPGQKWPEDWSRDGRFLVYFDRPASGRRRPRLSVLPMFGDRKPFALYGPVEGMLSGARFSPDQRWVTFWSDESGRSEVYAVSFPDGKRKIQISNAGGAGARWRTDGRELFYPGPERKLMVVDVEPGTDLRVGTPRPLFDLPAGTAGWDITPDGQRFLVNVPVVESNAVPLSLVLNWTAGLSK